MARLERAFRRDSDFKAQGKELVQWKGQAPPSRWDDICPSVEMGEDRVHYDKMWKCARLSQEGNSEKQWGSGFLHCGHGSEASSGQCRNKWWLLIRNMTWWDLIFKSSQWGCHDGVMGHSRLLGGTSFVFPMSLFSAPWQKHNWQVRNKYINYLASHSTITARKLRYAVDVWL